MKLKNFFRTFALGALVITLVLGCKNSSGTGEYGYEKLYPNASDIAFDDFQIVELSKDVTLGDIEKICVEDSLIFISSNECLYSFNMDGSLHAQYGMKGRAANEYNYLSAFYVDKKSKQVFIVDFTLGKLNCYRYDGSFVSSNVVEALKSFLYDVRLLTDGRLFVNNRIFNDSRVLYSIINLNDGSVKELRSVPFSTNNTSEFCGEHMCNIYNGKMYYIAPFEPYIYVLEEDKETVCKEIAGVSDIPRKSELENITDYNFFTSYNMYNEGKFVGFTGLYETDSFILLNEMVSFNYYIIDKTTGKQKRYQYSIDEDAQTLPIKNIRAAYKDWFIGVGSPMNLMQLSEDLPRNPSDPYLKKFKEIAEKTTTESNPCLFFYKIKSI